MDYRQDPAIRVVMMPRDTNVHGTIFGGIILSHLDLAGAVEARWQGCERVVSVALHEVIFHEPVFVGDLVSFYTRTDKIGRTSISVKIRVEVRRFADPRQKMTVTEASIVYVNVDEKGRPTEVPRSTE
jgi:acyl-CoA thioesterase YciA